MVSNQFGILIFDFLYISGYFLVAPLVLPTAVIVQRIIIGLGACWANYADDWEIALNMFNLATLLVCMLNNILYGRVVINLQEKIPISYNNSSSWSKSVKINIRFKL